MQKRPVGALTLEEFEILFAKRPFDVWIAKVGRPIYRIRIKAETTIDAGNNYRMTNVETYLNNGVCFYALFLTDYNVVRESGNEWYMFASELLANASIEKVRATAA